MCGLAGIAGNYVLPSDQNIFKTLLILAGLRGHHSTGVFVMGKQKYNDPISSYWIKETSNPFSYCLKGYIDELDKKYQTIRCMAGHARYATKGEVTTNNAHPFQAGKVVGMHNGTLFGEYDFKKDFGTDSEALINNIEKKGLKAGLEHINDKGGGAYTIVYGNTEDETLNFIRNKERPLWLMKTEKSVLSQKLYWASEKSALEYIRMKYGLKCEDPIELPENTRLTYKITDVDFLDKAVETEEAIVSNQHFFPTTNTTSNWKGSGSYAGYGSYKNGYWDSKANKWQTFSLVEDLEDDLSDNWENDWEGYYSRAPYGTEKKESSPEKNEKKPEEKHLGTSLVPITGKPKANAHTYTGYKGETLLKSEASTFLNRGCAWCSSPKTTADPVRWITRKEFVCEDCKEAQFVKDYLKALGILEESQAA